MAVGVLDPRKGLIWQDDGSSLSPEQIEQLQALEVRKRMGGVDTSPVNDWTQGAARVVDALGGVLRERRLANAAEENQSYNAGLSSPLTEALGASYGSSPVPMSGAGQEMSATSPNVSPEISSGIVDTATSLGIDPVDLGTAISYETGGTFDPVKAGPKTQWGQHKGLIQFGEPQAQQYGVDWNNPVGSQLGPNGAVANYLRSTGVKPGMGLMDIYSAINAGGVGRYGASDANNGGAPGTVADKVNQQMAGHRARAMALLGGQKPPAQAAIQSQSPVNPGATAPQLPAPVEVAAAPSIAPLQDQAPAAPTMQQQASGIPPQALAAAIRAASDPRASEGTKAVAQAVLQRAQAQEQNAQEQNTWMQRQQYEQQLQSQDPLRQAQIEKLRRDSANPNADETFYGNTVPIQNKDGSVAYGQIGNKGTFKPISLGEGQQFAPPTKTIDTGTEMVLVDQTGNVISRTPKQNFQAAYDTGAGSASAKTDAETKSEYSSITSKMPGLYSVVDRLKDLAGKATYTLPGQVVDWGLNQAGAKPREGAVARAEYTAIVDNQILPLLRDTFGAQFTQEEGSRLSKTLGDPDKSPVEKQALLRAFIEQKERDISALETKMGNKANSTPTTQRRKFNPATGEIE